MNACRMTAVVLFAGATAAIWMWPKAERTVVAEQPVRPVRSFVIGDATKFPDRKFSGIVKANARRMLSFKEAGRIARIPVSNGQCVRKGERLAWLFDGDFTNRVENCRAAAERDRLTCKRVQDAAKRNAVSKEELSKAESQLRQSEAQLALAERSLRATVIYAPFDGVIARTVATELEVVSGPEPIVEIQDLSQIKIDVAVPESLVIIQKQVKCETAMEYLVSFDSFPQKSFTARFEEYTASADAKTQTFTATYSMDNPEALLVLPGMSATVTVPGVYCRGSECGKGKTVRVPANAVGVDGQGESFVWVMENCADDAETYVVRKRTVGGCLPDGAEMSVATGLKPGERIATAGIAVLTEGRKVRPL